MRRSATFSKLCPIVVVILAGCAQPHIRRQTDDDPSHESAEDAGMEPDGAPPADDDSMDDEVSPDDQSEDAGNPTENGDDEDEEEGPEPDAGLDSGTELDSGMATDAATSDAGDAAPPDPCGASPCDAIPQASCENTGAAAFTCACPDGFDGDGVGSAGCTPRLMALSLDPEPLNTSFDPATLAYAATVPAWIETVWLHAEAPPHASISVDGRPLPDSGVAELALAAGDHDILVEVTSDGASRSYVVAVQRGEEQGYLKADYPSTSSYGYSVSLSGDRLAIGALGENSNGWSEVNTSAAGSGAVFIMRRGEDGVWSQEKWLKPPDPVASQRFGNAVALSGTRLVVGVKWEASDGINRTNSAYPGSGAAYVYELDSMGAWRERGYLKANPPLKQQEFGRSVAIEGDLLAVGEPVPGAAGATGPRSSGSVWIYRREVDAEGKIEWKYEARLAPSNPDFNDYFGFDVSLSGSRIAVGAPREAGDNTSPANNDRPYAGAVYVFRRNADRTWTETDYLKAAVPVAPANFGGALSLKGDLLAIGAAAEPVGGASNAGAVYLFEADASGSFQQRARLQGELPGANEYFGRSVALDESGDWLFVGADQDRSTVSLGYGAVFGYRRVEPASWELRTTLSATIPDYRDQFGYDVSVDHGRVAVGAPSEDGNRVSGPEDDSKDTAGAAYVFE